MRLDLFSWRLGAVMVLVLGCTAPLAAQERATRGQTEVSDAQAAARDEAEITVLRSEVQALRRDVNRLIELLEARSVKPQQEERAKPAKKAAAVEDERQPQRRPVEIYTVTYTVAELVAPVRKMVTVHATGKQAEEGKPLPPPVKPDFEALEAFITSRILPESWDENGGPAAIQAYGENLSLVISQTKEGHEEIAKLLSEIRHAKRRQVSLDMHIIMLTGRAAESVTPRPLEGVTLLTTVQAKMLLDLANNGEDAKRFRAPKLTLLSGQTANLQSAESPIGELDLLLHVALGKDSHSIRLRAALNAQDKYDVLSSSESLNVPDGQSALLELACEGGLAANGNGILSSLISGAHARKAAKSPDGKTGRRLILVTPRIVEDEEEEELLGIPASP